MQTAPNSYHFGVLFCFKLLLTVTSGKITSVGKLSRIFLNKNGGYRYQKVIIDEDISFEYRFFKVGEEEEDKPVNLYLPAPSKVIHLEEAGKLGSREVERKERGVPYQTNFFIILGATDH